MNKTLPPVNRTLPRAIAILAAMCLAFALRVIPAWESVFTPRGISFQEPDAWFHMRAIHNLAAHFPWRSGFDPYILYRSSANNSAAPLWDYIVALAAWLSGAGSPSGKLVDQMGAWLPAIIGALFPVPVYFLARRLFGNLAGLLSAFWVSILPAAFLWVSHLGMPDHHAIESLTSFLVLGLVSLSVESEGRRRWWIAGLAGIALGGYLDIRAAGIFVPGTLALAALFEPRLALIVAAALGIACAGFIGGSGSLWSGYTWLTLIGGIAVAVLSAIVHRAAANRNWPRWVRLGTFTGSLAVAFAIFARADPAGMRGIVAEVSRFLPWHSGTTAVDQIKELQPLWRSGPGGLGSLFAAFGAAWILIPGGLAGAIWAARRRPRPALTLFLLWSLTMIAGVIFQWRMGAYAGPVAAILAGVASAWIVERIPAELPWLRGVAAAILIAVCLTATAPFGIAQVKVKGGPDADWWSAMAWLRANTPEPMGDAQAWYRFWPALHRGEQFKWPESAYGVLAFGDQGWWITALAHRIPIANGEQDGIAETSQFLSETSAEEGLRELQRIGARYAVVGPDVVTVHLPAIVALSSRRIQDYSRLFLIRKADGGDLPVRVYLPAFYRSMGARLYLFDGARESSDGAEVFVTDAERTDAGAQQERFVSVEKFASGKDASAWIAAHPWLRTTLGSSDPTRSCVDTEGLTWAKRVFASREERIEGDRQPSVVKIFALGIQQGAGK